ncbi:metalloregulator ArsR/SmtB family transcription factor (plasmid) [Deinococcus sp. KNUC1210]|uniref:ArsR/SmtB family transcription factor n=1 Tax=Deinococcus sp. KNUC1210 TaxID=2917691 RepID=UPI001EF067C6|nr:metalloregulator ArsR/SmtB family transcription factor [Deinococcus sp. KNUC1210]ULH14052.1 metalloregulator ArsR/SmtB family transcription factor [Deinococcus sp. KNUC1210]
MSYGIGTPNGTDDLFRALADPTRRALLEHLLQGEGEIVRVLTERAGISQAAVSKHLRVLKEAGLVQDHPDGRTVHYRADIQGFTPLIDWLNHYASFWSSRLDRLETLLERMEE